VSVEYAAQAFPFIEYDGTNAIEVANAIEEFRSGCSATITSQSLAQVTIEVSADEAPTDIYTILAGQRFGLSTGLQIGPADWATKWVSA
jgi:hypothetical protein